MSIEDLDPIAPEELVKAVLDLNNVARRLVDQLN